MVRASVFTILASTLCGLAAQAAVAPYDFTGHWIGCPVGQQTLLEGDFTATGLRKFKGSLTVEANTPEQCTVKGKRKTEQVVLARFNCHGPCDQGPGLRKSKVRLQGQLDVGSETISGTATITEKGCGKGKTNTRQLVITKATSPPSLCPTPTTTTVPTPTTTTAPRTTTTSGPSTTTTSTSTSTSATTLTTSTSTSSTTTTSSSTQPPSTTTSSSTTNTTIAATTSTTATQPTTTTTSNSTTTTTTAPLAALVYNDPSTNYIYRIDPDGSNNIQLSSFYSEGPRWSPDRSKVAFLGYQGGSFELYTVNADGTGLTQITTGMNLSSGGVDSVSWSPDATRVVAARNDGGFVNCYIVTLATGEVTQLTQYSQVGECEKPDWSPDGTNILFRRLGWEFWTVHPDGTNLTKVVGPLGMGYDPAPRWSPDGSKITFHADGNCGGNVKIINADGTGLEVITPGYYPTWSPDGSKLAYAICGGSPFANDIYVANANAANPNPTLVKASGGNTVIQTGW